MLQVPTDYIPGYAQARAIAPELADRYIAHTTIGDPTADAVVEELASLGRSESSRIIQAGTDGPNNPMLLDAPPLVRDFFAELGETPPWLDPAAFRPAYRMFHRNSQLVLAGMVGGVLVEGFSTNISKSFFITGRLRDQGVRRLRQNNRQMVEIFLPGGLETYGEGWKLSVRVRLVHATIRRLMLGTVDWNAAAWGLPISAAHLGFANAVFSARLLKHLAALGGHFNDEERASFMAVWRYTGHVMGIPDTILFQDEAEALRLFEIGGMCEPPPGVEAASMSNALVNSAPMVIGIDDTRQRRSLVRYVYKVSRAMIGNDLADQLAYPSDFSWGVLPWFRLQTRYQRLIGKLWPKHATHSNFSRFTNLFGASQYDEGGISYALPDHVYSEESSRW